MNGKQAKWLRKNCKKLGSNYKNAKKQFKALTHVQKGRLKKEMPIIAKMSVGMADALLKELGYE